MIRSLYCPKDGQHRTGLSLAEIAKAAQDKEGLIWVSLEHATDEEIKLILGDTFHFHPLAIEDCLSRGYQTPKVDDFGDYLFIIAHALESGSVIDHASTMELNFFLGTNFLVTSYHEECMSPVQSVWDRLSRDERPIDRGADGLCHAILDTLVDEYMPVIDSIDEEIDQIEDLVLRRPDPVILQRILTIKHSLLNLRRILAPQREVMNRLSRDDLQQIQPHNRIYFRDIYDHLVRLHDLGESVRDVIAGALDIYLTSTSNRMNEIMKTLTLVSTIFLPLTFIAGVYGMNFDVLPELHWRYSYFVLWGIFITIAGGMIWLFKRKRWL